MLTRAGEIEKSRADVSERAATRGSAVWRWIAWVAFAVVSAIGIRAHTLWFDEMQAWNIARASHSLGDLATNLRYEGHPVLWYLPLYALTRLTGNPHAMQLLQWCIAAGTAWLVLFRAPLRFGLRCALLAGYFFAFEYGVLSRSYGLGVLLLVWALVCLARSEPRWGWATVALVALAATSLPGAVLAVAVAASVLLDADLRRLACARALAAVVAVTAAAVALTCIPPDDFGQLTPGLGDSSKFGSGATVRLASSAAAAWRALAPLPASVGEWNTNVLDRFPGAVWVQAVLAVALVAGVWIALRSFAFARRLWLVGSVALVGFFVVVTRPEASRHAGFAFLLFVACVWSALAPPGRPRAVSWSAGAPGAPRDALGTVLLVALAAQVLATLMVYPSASTEDFSRDAALARAVHAAGLDDVIVSAQDWDATTVGGYLDRDVWSIARGEHIRFLVTDTRQERGVARLDVDGVTCAAQRRADDLDRSVALIVAGELQDRTPLAENDGAFVYRFEPGGDVRGCS